MKTVLKVLGGLIGVVVALVICLVLFVLATLKPNEERVLRMLDLEQLAVKEISAQLNWGESRVKVTAFRARKKLQKTLKEMEGGLADES